jgi:alkylation response protein AidB-like acyl-CoA dehydrogenase
MFFQEPPRLRNTYRSDVVLHEHLERLLPPEVRAEVEAELDAMGEAAAGELSRLAAQAEASPPRLVQYDPWGRRIDRIEVSGAWSRLHAVQARAGLGALPYEDRHGRHDRVVQHALLHLYGPSSAVYSCPVAMTDAAVRVLVDHAPAELRERVVPRLTSRDPERAWTSGQWMTEREGGSDVGRTATVARRDEAGRWRLHGVKWFTSATTADCALALARPEGAPEGSRGLGLFLVELVDPFGGRPQLGSTILVNRLKDKLGTRALPTAELTLAGALATPVGGVDGGLKKIAGMLNVTRLHNAVSAAAGMRRGVELAASYASARDAFGRPLTDLPLHKATLADLAVEAEAAFALVARGMELLARTEHGVAGEPERRGTRTVGPRERGRGGVRRRRLRRGQRHPAAAARRAGPAHLGRHDQRAQPRPAAGGVQGGGRDRAPRGPDRAARRGARRVLGGRRHRPGGAVARGPTAAGPRLAGRRRRRAAGADARVRPAPRPYLRGGAARPARHPPPPPPGRRPCRPGGAAPRRTLAAGAGARAGLPYSSSAMRRAARAAPSVSTGR